MKMLRVRAAHRQQILGFIIKEFSRQRGEQRNAYR